MLLSMAWYLIPKDKGHYENAFGLMLTDLIMLDLKLKVVVKVQTCWSFSLSHCDLRPKLTFRYDVRKDRVAEQISAINAFGRSKSSTVLLFEVILVVFPFDIPWHCSIDFKRLYWVADNYGIIKGSWDEGFILTSITIWQQHTSCSWVLFTENFKSFQTDVQLLV